MELCQIIFRIKYNIYIYIIFKLYHIIIFILLVPNYYKAKSNRLVMVAPRGEEDIKFLNRYIIFHNNSSFDIFAAF